MTEESTGGWLTPERKKAIFVSLYIWVPLGVFSLILWTFFPPLWSYKANFSKSVITALIYGFITAFAFVLIWCEATKRKSAIYGSLISFIWTGVMGWGHLTDSKFFESIKIPIIHELFWWFGVPLLICYIYNKKGVIKFTWDGYLAALLFSDVVGLFGAMLAGH